MKSIQDLKNIHLNEDIWIIAAGSSMNFINPSFFENKITIGQNQVYRKFKCDYVVMKDLHEAPRFTESVKELISLNIPLIYSKYHAGHYNSGVNKLAYDNSYVFEHNDNAAGLQSAVDVIHIDTTKIAVHRSTMTSAMHIAAYMGAKNIIICGNDSGKIDGKLYYDDYGESNWISGPNNNNINTWILGVENSIKIIRDRISEIYNCNIYSLNPFLNFNLDGHEFTK